MGAPVVWFEVMGQNGPALQQFYATLFDWELTPMDNGYATVDAAEPGIPGGVGPAPSGPGHVTFYVQVPDIDIALTGAVEAGGKVVMPRTQMPDVVLGLFADPEGHLVGLVEG